MLEIQNLDVYYGNMQALWDVSLEVHEGEIVALVGANEAGKSTLLNSVVGLKYPASGEIYCQGEKITGLSCKEIVKKGIAYLPEGGRLFLDMTIRENLEMGAYLSHVWKRRKGMIDYVYQTFPQLKEREKQLAKTLSGGEQQMLAMGRGLMSNPRLFLLDELSYGLAPKLVAEAFKVLNYLRDQGITILLVEQNVRQTLEIADRAYVLENGRMALCGNCDDLLESDYIKKAYLGL